MVTKVTRWFTPEEATGRVLQDGEGVRSRITMMDDTSGALMAQTFSDAAARRARDSAYQAMRDGLSNSWQSGNAPKLPRGEREAAFAASVKAAQASSQRIADAREDSAEAHKAMVLHLNNSWRGAA
jgi:hypothetical protein